MNRGAAFVLTAFVHALVLSHAAAGQKPVNLVFIMSDDQAAWSIGCYGNPEARTPALDRLAVEGVRLASAFATIPVCSPSRATFHTGRIPSQHGIHDWIKNENMGPRARYCLEGEVLLSEILAKHGYVCGMSGKWHLGDSLRPHAGFSYWFAMPEGASRYNNAEMCWQGRVMTAQGYVTDRITDRAIDFLDEHRDRPFFLNVSYSAPHSPWEGHPPELVDFFRNCSFDSIPQVDPHPWGGPLQRLLGNHEAMRQYFAAVTGLDRGVARIVEHLERLGLSENTLVVFISDQGFNIGHHGFWGKGNGTNPRNMFDTSLRVPAIFRHKSRLPAGKTCDALISGYDFVPTLLDYLNLPPSPGRNLPGRSFAPLLEGREVADWPDAVFAEYGRTRMIRTRDWKLVHRADGGPYELYDLRNDPDEHHNLAGTPAHRERLVRLRRRIFDWFGRYGEAGADPVGQEYLRPEM